jgi:hypothetical protein
MHLFSAARLKRLATHEDGAYFHAHKILGVYCLAHFAVRLSGWVAWLAAGHGLGSVAPAMFDIGDGSGRHKALALATLLPHALLHLSSFQFKLSPRRNHAYNIIWPEMRWHTALFAYRSLAAMLLAFLLEPPGVHLHHHASPALLHKLARVALVFATLLSADAITAYYKRRALVAPEDSTMRGNPFSPGTPALVRRLTNLFYSTSQVFATLNVLARGPDSAFLVLLPIQTAPLGMTLVRKGFLSQTGWHVFYAGTLLLNYAYGLTALEHLPPQPLYRLCALAFCLLRFGLNANKYALWGAVAAAHLAWGI